MKFLLFAGLFISLAIFIACAVNPVTGEKQLMLLSESDAQQLGKQTDAQITQQYGLYEESDLNRYIDEIGQDMARLTHRPNLDYHFKILDTPTVNAFAVPGGYVYFTRGILSYFNNEAELAGVMGHELGHVNARHSASRYSQQMLAQIGVQLGAIISEDFAEWAPVALVGVKVLFLKFSRDDERQADDLGVRYSTLAGYDANSMATFFSTLQRLHPQQSLLPDWFSTHPSPADRVAAVRQHATDMQNQDERYVTRRKDYLTRIDGMIIGDDPRHGYVSGQAFYHPAMTFTFPVPPQWDVTNGPKQVQILSSDDRAALLFSMAPGQSPLDASRKFIADNEAIVVSSSSERVNNFATQIMTSDIQSQSGVLRLLSYFYEKDANIFVFHGIASKEAFPNYRAEFENTMNHFNRLTDQSKINVKPNRLNVREATNSGTLRSVLRQLDTPADKLEDVAVLNGMHLDDQIQQGTLVKTISP